LTISGGTFNIKTDGGSTGSRTTKKGKGLKAATDIVIRSGNFTIDSHDDAIHSKGTITIDGGTFNLATADDGIHANTKLTINDGTINITKSYEGLESYNIELNGGFVKLKAEDDGINISDLKSSSSSSSSTTGGGNRPGQGGGGSEADNGGLLKITGGEYYVESTTGDGMDSNGKIEMTGGTVVVFGPIKDPEVPIDYNGTFVMTGGTIVATGKLGSMKQQPNDPNSGQSGLQYSFMYPFSSTVAANTLINVSSSTGKEIVTVKTIKSAPGLVVCSPLLDKGSYTVSSGGTHSGTINNLNIYSGGTYSGGSVLKTFTISNIATTVN